MDRPGYKKAADLKDLPDNQTVEVEIGPLPLLLHRRGDKVYATGRYCAHQDVPLYPDNCSGDIILCTAHGYRMNIRTGACLTDGSLKLTTYPTEVDENEVWVKLF